MTARAGCAPKASRQPCNPALRSTITSPSTIPVQQVIIYLNPKTKTATVFHFGEVGPTAPVTSAKQSKPKEKTNIRVGGQPAIGSGPTDTLGVPPCPADTETYLQPVSPVDPDVTTSRMDATTSPNNSGATIVPLGTKTIEGVSATGTQNYADHQCRYNGE